MATNTLTLMVKVDDEMLRQVLEGLPYMEKAFGEILLKRNAQDEQWGGADHDDTHDAADWCAFIETQTEKLFMGLQEGQMPTDAAARERFVNIAALAVAAIQSIDRKAAREDQVSQEAGA